MTHSYIIINIVIEKYNLGTKMKEISTFLDINISTLYKWLNIYKNNFNSNILFTEKTFKEQKKIHGASKTHNYEASIVEYVDNNNGCSLNDIHMHIDKHISKSSICKLLKKNKITRKKVNTRIVGKDIEKIKQDRHNFSDKIKNENIIFNDLYLIDESSFCINDYSNKGYSKSGVEIKKTKKHKKTQERRTIISCVNIKGIHMHNVVEGSVNGSVFVDFIQKNREELYNKTLLLDNARIHHNKNLKDFCIENNITLLYNAPYTPEFNPIEYMFSTMKTHFRNINHDDLMSAINNSICIINGQDLSAYYKKCKENIDKYCSN